jgi:DNA-binding NarL/FixJ family response regulator
VQILTPTNSFDREVIEEALRDGAIGYVLKDLGRSDLAEANWSVHRGVPVLAPTPAVTWALVQAVGTRRPTPGVELTQRGCQVLALVAQGRSDHDIAGRLVITDATVTFHTRKISRKLHAANRVEIILVALRHRLIPPIPR